jgi:hypothetical protein
VGALEVDGAAGADHERDRVFGHHGLRVAERFESRRRYRMPGGVVAVFLRLLEMNGRPPEQPGR